MSRNHLGQLLLLWCGSLFQLLAVTNSSIPGYARAAGLLPSPLQQRNLKLLRPALDDWSNAPEMRRHRRDAEDFADYDENADIIPDLALPSDQKRLEERLQEQAEQIAESFRKMWESLGESMRHMAEGFQQMFGDSNTAPQTTDAMNNELMKREQL